MFKKSYTRKNVAYFFVVVWSVFIQIETVALKAVGLPEEGTFRIGGKRVRLRTIPSHMHGHRARAQGHRRDNT